MTLYSPCLVLDGTPRDCIVNACSSQADSAIIRDAEIDRGMDGPLGWTQGGGDCILMQSSMNTWGLEPRQSIRVEDNRQASPILWSERDFQVAVNDMRNMSSTPIHSLPGSLS